MNRPFWRRGFHAKRGVPLLDVSTPVLPHDATGNFTRIVLRLPVRIRLAPGPIEPVRCEIKTKFQPSLKPWLRRMY